MSHSSEQDNGNTQINIIRGTFNNKVSRLKILGRTKKVQWSDKRRWRSI